MTVLRSENDGTKITREGGPGARPVAQTIDIGLSLPQDNCAGWKRLGALEEAMGHAEPTNLKTGQDSLRERADARQLSLD